MRFESADGLTLTVWDDPGRYDWFLSGPDLPTVRRHVTAQMAFSDLATTFWSNDHDGEALLADIRTG